MSSLASQITPLILVVDLEATCCDQGSITADEMEIIEIGACWASEDGVVLDTFECFVRPTRRPVLTTFCKELLGISQEQVDSAEVLTNVAPKFERFVSQRLADATAWGSWGHTIATSLNGSVLVLASRIRSTFRTRT